MSFTEDNYEKAVITLFEQMGYTHLYGPDIERDYYVPFYEEQLMDSLLLVNREKPRTAIQEAIAKLKDIDTGSLTQKNEQFMDYLQHGIEVSYFDGKEQRNDIVYLIDYDQAERNDFKIVNQWTFVEHSEKRADIILFINGLPLVVMELKSPSREETDASEAYLQLRNYMQEIPSLFVYNVFCVMSDMACSKAGTITSKEDRYMEWKTKDGDYESTDFADYDTFFEGIFQKERLLDIIKNFVCFSKDEAGSAKILAGYHQYFAVKKAIERTKIAVQNDGKIGVFWHTQGSGKSLSMVFYAHLLQDKLSQPTIVVITDRNDLDDQLYTQFAKCKDFLRQEPVQAKSREDLKSLLAGREANGIIFTTMQKFEESAEPLSLRKNIVVMTDEAHRGQYGFEEKIRMTKNEKGEEVAKRVIGTARIIHDCLPNASYIGFTGTPISTKDRDTVEVFGNYIDVYDMTQAVADGATCPVYYESRVVNLNLDETTLKAIDDEYDLLAEEGATEEQIEKSKREMSHLEEILGAPATIDSLCRNILKHYEENRQYILTGKAMIVAYSRTIAMRIYDKLLELRPDWGEKVKVVMTASNKDPEEWHAIIGNKQYKKELAKHFKDNNDPMKIAIVVDMWLTGFDVPSLATMYGHNLMQAIARVNRVFNDKAGGLVVDYIGIAKALKEAMHDYTRRDRKNFGNPDIKETALLKFREKLEVCQDLFHGYDYSRFRTATDAECAQIIKGGVNFILSADKQELQQTFLKEAMLLHNSITLCRSLLDEQQRYEAAFFETVRTLLSRMTGKGKVSKREINARIGELLKQSVKSNGVINLFSDVKAEFSLFDAAFLDEISKMKEKNIAVELLKRLLAERVTLYQKTNIVQAEKFSDLLNRSLSSYLKGLLTNEEVIQELLNLAKEISSSESAGNDLGLTREEKSFYDALTKPQAVQDVYTNEQLVAMTKELTEILRKNRTIDWQKKESARAGMRKMVKRLLKKYHYPPEEAANALETVIRQCEQWTDNEETISEPKLYSLQESSYSMAAEPRAKYGNKEI